MELLFSVVGGGLVELGKCMCAGIYPKVKNTINFQSNLNNLKTEIKNLRNHRDSVKDQLEKAESDGHLHRDEVTEWLKAVQELENEVNSILPSMEINTAGNPLKWCIGSTLGMEVAKILKEVKQITKAGTFPSGLVIENYQLRRRVEHIPGPSIADDQSTASTNLSKVLSLLNEEDVRRIGVWGMGGVGKTTLVKNLNNMFEKSSTTQPFSIIIWANVSKNFDLKGVQRQIADRLELLEVSMIDDVGRTATLLYHRLMEEKGFLLILDDVWEAIDLDRLGIPQPEQHNSYKVILTSRSLDVCRQMRTDVEVKVDILSDEESWNLFTRYAGNVVTLSHIEPLAKQITRECRGLPLAIIVVGASMRGKAMVELWKDALNALRTSMPHTNVIEDRVYLPLKWSYDSLQIIYRKGLDIKSCFLYCCLYPEDFLIDVEELVHSWLAEDFIDELGNYEALFNRGIALVEYLKDSCLLEDGISEGTVKMHDVVRDVAIWIACFVEAERGFLVKSGIGLTRIAIERESLKRVSFMDNRITNLPDCAIQLPNLSTLLLQCNRRLENVPEGFLLGFPAIKVLNLSYTNIQTLPPTLLKCGELQALFLRRCSRLVEIPSLGGLTKLKMIDFSGSAIKELPEGMDKLTNLRQLFLLNTESLSKIRAGIISHMSSLEVLDMAGSAYKWAARVKVGVREGEASFEELECLTQLSVLNIHLDLSCLSINALWIIRLKKIQFFIGENMLVSPIETQFDEVRAMLCSVNFNKTWSLHLLNCATSISLEGCEGFEQNPQYFNFTYLKSLHITVTHLFKQENRGKHVITRNDLLPNLEELVLYRVKGMNSISYLASHFGLRLSKLRVIRVLYCDDMNYILSIGGLVVDLESLEEITIRSCNNVVELFRCESSSQTSALVDTSVLNLKIVRLTCLASLKTLSEPHVVWQRLELLQVINCKLFKKLPFTAQVADTIKEIRGEPEWWDQIEWDDKNTKSTLQQYFTGDDIRW